MSLLLWRIVTLVLASLSMALSFCHVMEMPARLSWDPALWMQTTTFGGLYYLFGRVGAAIDVSAIIAAWVLVYRVRDRPPSFWLALAGAVQLAAGLVVWFTVVSPMNQVMAIWRPGPIPSDFRSVRDQWEYSHAAIWVVKMSGLTMLILSVSLTEPVAGARSPTMRLGDDRPDLRHCASALGARQDGR